MPKRSANSPLPLAVVAGERRKFAALYGSLSKAIADGRLRKGTRLPSSRDLAAQQNLARGTVIAVYEQLGAEGFLQTRRGAGTFVRGSDLGSRSPAGLRLRPVGSAPPPVRRIDASPFPVSREPPRPFRANVPALDLFPRHIWARLAGRHWRNASAASSSDPDPRGAPWLRATLAEYLSVSRAIRCTVDNIVIVPGTQTALDIIVRTTLARHDVAWVEDPGYPGARHLLREGGADVVPIPVDQEGMVVPPRAHRLAAPRLIHVTPARQSPLGVTLSLPRRQAVLERARAANAFVFEDDYDGEFRYGLRPLGALQGMDRDGRVVHAGSFSKTLLPSLRLGYMVVPDGLIDPVLSLLSLSLRFVSPHDQTILAAFMDEGHFARHVRRQREAYAVRHAMLRSECARLLSGLVEFDAPAAGLDCVAWLPRGWSDRSIVRRLVTAGIEARALSHYRVVRAGRPGLVLGAAAFDERTIRHAVARLAATLEHRLQAATKPT